MTPTRTRQPPTRFSQMDFTPGSNNDHTGPRPIDPVDFDFDPEERGDPGFQPQGVADLSWNEHDRADNNPEMASYESESEGEAEQVYNSDDEEEAGSDSGSDSEESEAEQVYNSDDEEEAGSDSGSDSEESEAEQVYNSDDEEETQEWTTRFIVSRAAHRSLTQPVLELMMDMLFAQGTPCRLHHAGRGTVGAVSDSQAGLAAATLAINRFLGRGDLDEIPTGMDN